MFPHENGEDPNLHSTLETLVEENKKLIIKFSNQSWIEFYSTYLSQA